MAELTGKQIEFFLPTSYASVVEGLLGGFIHVAVLGPYAYVIANEKDPSIEVFATYAKKPGHMQEEGPGYRAALISKTGSKFTDIESLKGATLGLVDPGSTNIVTDVKVATPLVTTHSLPIPNDVSFIGRVGYFQGGTVTNGVVDLCNGVQAMIGY